MNETIHAEQAAIALAFARGERRVLVLMTERGHPCGHCLQFLCELSEIDSVTFVGAGENSRFAKNISSLLPFGMRPSALLTCNACDSEAASAGGLFTATKPKKLVLIEKEEEEDELDCAALLAAQYAHCPYSNNHAAVALMLDSPELGGGTFVCAGACIESVAFNPTMPPLHVCLVTAVADFRENTESSLSVKDIFEKIKAAVLVEESSLIGVSSEEENKSTLSWEKQTRLLLNRVAPNCAPLRVRRAMEKSPQWSPPVSVPHQ